jgi:diguanylate cyclase with GGDEF domain
MASNKEMRIRLEKRGISAGNLKKYELYNSEQLIRQNKQDRYLEQHGLLDFQTQGLSQADIANRYQQAGVRVNPDWAQQHYAGTQPQPPAQQTPVAPVTPVKFATTQDVITGVAPWSDVESTNRKKILSDPNFYASGQIANYPIAVRDQILNDPNFDWSKLPKWQRTYYSFISNPKYMALPMVAAGAHAGKILGPIGAVAGGALGYGLGVVGGQQYDPLKGIADQPTTVAKAMAVLNKLSEGAEQSGGFAYQLLDAAIAGTQGNKQAAEAAQKMISDPAYRKATWEAGRITYEASDFLGARNWVPALAMLLGDKDAVLAKPGEDFIIGSAAPVEHAKAKGFNPVTGDLIDVTDSAGILQEARLTIHKAILAGNDPDDVIRTILGEQSQYVGALVADFGLQAKIDPLETLPEVTAKTTSKLAGLLGNETAARAFAEAKAPIEGIRRYQTLIQTGDVAPGFDYSKMSSVSRWLSGINKEGQIKAGPFTSTGLLDKPVKATVPAVDIKSLGLRNLLHPLETLKAWKEDMVALTPESRAREGANMFYNNLGSLFSTMDDPRDIARFIGSISNGNMELWKEMGGKIANAPEFYTVLPALKDFKANIADGMAAMWDGSAPRRDALLNIADLLGEEPGTLIEDLAKRGTAAEDLQRIAERLSQSSDPDAVEFLRQIQSGGFTAEHLQQIINTFTGNGALPWHPDQWKAMLMDTLGEHFDNWAVEQLGLGKDTPESKAFFRTTHLLKSAQSILLLGGSPGYALQNGMSNMVHRAATGIYGYLTPRQIDSWLDRFGVTPARLEEGVGMGGEVEFSKSGVVPSNKKQAAKLRIEQEKLREGKQASASSGVQTSAIDKAIRGNQNDALGKAQRWVSVIGRGMPFNKLSSAFEQLEGKNGYMIAMRDMWSQTWRRGRGFAEVTPELKGHLERAGINPNNLYALIEAGMNKDEIERFVYQRQSGIMSRTLVNDAAQKLGMPSTQAARLLEKVGVLDELDRRLSKASDAGGIRSAFTQAVRKAQDFQDMQTSRDLKAMAEAVTNKVSTEGAPAALDVVQRVNGEYFDAWLDHYSRFGETFEELRGIPDPLIRDRAIDLNYQLSDQEFRRINARVAANYQGIFEAWGKTRNPKAMEILAAIAQSDQAMKGAYDFMRSERRTFFDKLRENPDSIPTGEWDSVQTRIDREFDRAFKQKSSAEKQMGQSLGNVYTDMYGVAAGEAARKWWENYTQFSDDIVKREKEFRRSIQSMTKDQREAVKQKYYSTDKVAQIAELERINQEGIRRLERTIKNGGDGLSGRTTAPGMPPSPAPSSTTRTGGEEVNQLISDAETRLREETQAKTERVNSVWDTAEEFNRVGLPYDRGILQDRFALLGALRKEEYGGFPDLKGLDDERLTGEKVRSILDERSKVKANDEAARMEKALSTIPAPKITDNTNILAAIKEHGGLHVDLAQDLTGDTPRRTPGVFRKKGIQMDEMARMLADDGYPIDLNRPDDLGGIQQATDLLTRARQGEKVYPAGHDFEAQIKRAEEAYAQVQAEEANAFDMALWQKDLEDATASGDLTRMYEKIGELPEELTNEHAPSGETWNDWMSRIADETVARVEDATREQAVADTMSRIANETGEMEARGNAMQTKHILQEKFKDVFGLTDEQAEAYMELSESVSNWYMRITGESGDAFYSRYYEDVVSGGEGDLFQIEPVNRRMTPQEVGDYARALVRSGADELRRAVASEPNKADRIAILTEAHNLNPKLAEQVARQSLSVLFQEVWHGSPYKFDKFTLDHIGEGEGAQTYGWGLYFAEEKQVADYYRQSTSRNNMEYGTTEQKLHDYWEVVDEKQKALDQLRTQQDTSRQFQTRLKVAEFEYNQALEAAQGFGERPPEPGQLYRVDIPDENYLLWDKPFNEQSEGVRQALEGSGINTTDNPDGRTLYNRMSSNPRIASQAFKDVGLNGIKYFDKASRGAGEGTYNYVIFDDNATRILDTYYQIANGTGAKGAVTFGPDGIKATIHAFEAKDFSTLVHENAHVFRRVLADVAERSGNTKVLADLATIEEWAGVKDGEWTREHEEKFARGFERYITDGEAPTPKLKRAFESFKSWMLQVYKQITGSAIDVQLTDDVRSVFNRMLGEEKPVERMLGDRRQPVNRQLRDAWGKLDESQQSEVMDWIFKKTLVDPLSGLETLVAKDIEGTKPAGWVEAVSDLNALTAINNTWGHGAGDQIIKGIGEIAKVEVEKVGGRAFRVGGDEFSYWFPSDEAARTALDAIDKQVQEHVFTIGETKRKGFTVSYGIGDNLPSADKSLYADKSRRVELGQRSTVRDQMPPSVTTLFQNANPLGTMEDASGFKADSEWQDAGWKQHVRPLLDAMQTVALDKMQNEKPLDGAFKDMSAEGQQLLRSYVRQTQNDMGAVKNSTIKWGESQRDFAMLNYNRRYGFDRGLEVGAPYEFYYTRSLLTWAARGLDKPSWFANYARVRNLQNKHERDIPERLRNKFRIPAPWLPDWMGDALYIDPVSNLFTPANFLRPFEQMRRDKNQQVIEAERILQEWAQDGQATNDQILQAAQDQSGKLWERAFAEAQTRRESEISNPFDFMATMFGPAWYLSTPLNLAGIEVPFLSKGDKNKVTPTPLLNTARALEATTKGTWAEPIGQFAALLGRPEEMLRKKAGLPEFGEFGDYYVDRQLSNMVAEGTISSQQAQMAMIERKGELFDQARERVKMELALKTPLAGAVLAGTHEGAGAAAKSFLPSLFGSGLLPEGELEYRGLKSEWNEAWKKYDGGDKTAINNFFDDHPEYEAYLAKGKPPEERLKSFLIGNVWDAYMKLGPTNQKQVRAQMGEEFSRSFLDKETRSYDSMDVKTLTEWAQLLGGMIPKTPETAPVLAVPPSQRPKLNLLNPEVTKISDKFFRQRTQYFNNYYDLEQGYYALPRSKRSAYLLKNPELKQYWDWKKSWEKSYPDLVPIFKGQIFKRVDTSTWAPGLVDYVTTYAYSGKRLPTGAMKALEQQWIQAGRPYDDLKTWLDATVVPAMLYGGQP